MWFPLLPAVAQSNAADAQNDAPIVTLHVDTREVVLEVEALDRNHQPIADLDRSELQAFEFPRHGEKIPRPILSMRVVDPHLDAAQAESENNGFHLTTGAICALNAAMHYEIAIPAMPEPGFHELLVKSTRQHVQLNYRKHYFVGASLDRVNAKDVKPGAIKQALGEAACFHPLTPPTLELTAKVLTSPGGANTRYSAILRPESLPVIGINDTNTHLQLDYAICLFNASGGFMTSLHTSIDRHLSPEEWERAKAHGYQTLLEIPGSQAPYLARLAVIDRATGNLGVVDVSRPVSLAEQGGENAAIQRPRGSIRSFGVVTPREGSFCGDVYELAPGVTWLPNFWDLDPVGSLYTDKLDVPNQDITMSEGIPGITHNNTWFGIDYYGEFYVTKPGAYTFELESDDGSKLEIDNHVVIDNDGQHMTQSRQGGVLLTEGFHRIHVPYFQGPPLALSLMLRIQPPGEAMRPFSLAEFAQPKTVP